VDKNVMEQEMYEAESRAWEALAKGQFNKFASSASFWVELNRISGLGKRNPFLNLINVAKGVRI
jgi:hypothetical protein